MSVILFLLPHFPPYGVHFSISMALRNSVTQNLDPMGLKMSPKWVKMGKMHLNEQK